jgi:hypothetical protein
MQEFNTDSHPVNLIEIINQNIAAMDGGKGRAILAHCMTIVAIE